MRPDPQPLDDSAAHALSGVTTATLTTVLLKKGLRNVWMRGTRVLRAGQGRRVGRAFALRFVPAREDLATQQPVGCGGVAVFPNDVVVADDDGAVLIPAALLDEVIAAAVEQERLEGWIMEQVQAGQVQAGQALPGLYPPNEANKAAYQSWAGMRR